jgi:hypothetical protein
LSFIIQWNLAWVIAILVAYFTRSVIVTCLVAVAVVVTVRDTRRVWLQKSSERDVAEGKRTFKQFRQRVLFRIGQSVTNYRISRASKRYGRRAARRRAISTTEGERTKKRRELGPG